MRVEWCVVSCVCSRAVLSVMRCVLASVQNDACGTSEHDHRHCTVIAMAMEIDQRSPLICDMIVDGLWHFRSLHRSNKIKVRIARVLSEVKPLSSHHTSPDVRGPPGFLAVGTIKSMCNSFSLRRSDRSMREEVREVRVKRGECEVCVVWEVCGRGVCAREVRAREVRVRCVCVCA